MRDEGKIFKSTEQDDKIEVTEINYWSFPVTQLAKDVTMSLSWLGSLLWHQFNPWSKNFHMMQVRPKENKSKPKQKQWLYQRNEIKRERSTFLTL